MDIVIIYANSLDHQIDQFHSDCNCDLPETHYYRSALTASWYVAPASIPGRQMMKGAFLNVHLIAIPNMCEDDGTKYQGCDR
jgi:hypothetical protein